MKWILRLTSPAISRSGSAATCRAARWKPSLEEFKLGRLTEPELRRLLGFETRAALDGFLKMHGVYIDYTLEDLERDREDLRRLGL